MSIPISSSTKSIFASCIYCLTSGHNSGLSYFTDSQGTTLAVVGHTGISATATNGTSITSGYVRLKHVSVSYESTKQWGPIPSYTYNFTDFLASSSSAPDTFPSESSGQITLQHSFTGDSLNTKYPGYGFDALTTQGWLMSIGQSSSSGSYNYVFDNIEFIEGSELVLSGDMLRANPVPSDGKPIYLIYPVLVAPRIIPEPEPEPEPDPSIKSGALRFFGDSGMLCFNSNGNLVYY